MGIEYGSPYSYSYPYPYSFMYSNFWTRTRLCTQNWPNIGDSYGNLYFHTVCQFVYPVLFSGNAVSLKGHTEEKSSSHYSNKMLQMLGLKMYICSPEVSLVPFASWIKVRQFQNEFMKLSFLPKYEQNLSRFLPSLHRAEILTVFSQYFLRSDDFINSF